MAYATYAEISSCRGSRDSTGLESVREVSGECLDSVIAKLTSRLAAEGFHLSGREVFGDVVFVHWRHSLEWKQHAVRLFHGKQEPRSVGVSLQVYLEDDRDPALLDSIEVDAHAGHPGGYALPQTSLFPNLACERVTRRIMRDVEGALAWFDGFLQPRDCLAKLRSGSTMYGEARGALYQRMTTYLEDLSSR